MNSHTVSPYSSLFIYSYCFPFPLNSALPAYSKQPERGICGGEWPEVTFPEVLFSHRSLSSSISFTTSHICTDNTCGKEGGKKTHLGVRNQICLHHTGACFWQNTYPVRSKLVKWLNTVEKLVINIWVSPFITFLQVWLFMLCFPIRTNPWPIIQ